MKISVEWGRPLALRGLSRQNLMYVVDFDKVPDEDGRQSSMMKTQLLHLVSGF